MGKQLKYPIYSIFFKREKYYVWETPFVSKYGGGYNEYLVCCKNGIKEGELIIFLAND